MTICDKQEIGEPSFLDRWIRTGSLITGRQMVLRNPYNSITKKTEKEDSLQSPANCPNETRDFFNPLRSAERLKSAGIKTCSACVLVRVAVSTRAFQAASAAPQAAPRSMKGAFLKEIAIARAICRLLGRRLVDAGGVRASHDRRMSRKAVAAGGEYLLMMIWWLVGNL